MSDLPLFICSNPFLLSLLRDFFILLSFLELFSLQSLFFLFFRLLLKLSFLFCFLAVFLTLLLFFLLQTFLLLLSLPDDALLFLELLLLLLLDQLSLLPHFAFCDFLLLLKTFDFIFEGLVLFPLQLFALSLFDEWLHPVDGQLP